MTVKIRSIYILFAEAQKAQSQAGGGGAGRGDGGVVECDQLIK